MGFPVSPQPLPGDTYSAENRVWTYDGYGWRFLGASGSVNVTLTGNVNYTIGNTAPSGPNSGDKWFHINDAVEYTYIKDFDNTSHWIEIGMGCPSIGGETGINFPVTECIGDIYEYDSRIWIYKGYGWKIVCQNTGDSEFTFGLTAPSSPNPGHRWVDSATGLLYTFVNDYDPLGQTGQWVAFSNASEIIGPVGPTGSTGPTGPAGPAGYTEIFGTPNQIGVSTEGSGVTLYIPSLFQVDAITANEIASTQYYGTDMELYGTLDLPYGNLNVPSGVVTAPHHEGNLRLGGTEIQVRNASGGQLVKGTPVYIVDDIPASTHVDVDVSYCDTYYKVPAIGLIAGTINNNQLGYAITSGLLTGINTSNFAVNADLWVAPQSQILGVTYGLTVIEPVGITEYKHKIGKIVKSDATNGIIQVFGGDAFGKNIPNYIPLEKVKSSENAAVDNVLFISQSTTSIGSDPFFVKTRIPAMEIRLNTWTYVDPSPTPAWNNVTYFGVFPESIPQSHRWIKHFPVWREIYDPETLESSEQGWVHGTYGRGLSGIFVGGAVGNTFSVELNYSSPGITGLTFGTITTASTSDKILLQRKPSDKMELITVGDLLSTVTLSPPTNIPGDISPYKFAFFDSSGNQYSSSENNVKSQILRDNINTLNGCTGAVGITGTTGEIEVINSCPNIIIGLPDDVSITGNLTVNGFYFGFIDGGTFE